MKSNNITRVAFIISGITIICKILGFVKNSVLAYYFGTSPVVDAYVMTFSIGTITCGWIAGLVGNFTPVFKKVEANQGKNNALHFASSVHNYILLFVIILVIALEFFAETVVKVVAPGFDEVTFNYTVWFFRLYLISVLFYASYRFFNEFLNCNQEHIWASSPDVLMSACCIVAIFISSLVGESFLIFGYVIAVLFECIIVQIGSWKIGYRRSLQLKWNNDIKSLIVMAIPIFLSNTLAEINTLIDKIFASNLESGIVASLDYANTMKEFAFQIGTTAMVTMIFPVLSKHWASGEVEYFNDKVLKGINLLTVLYIPLIAGIILTGDLVINIVYKRGQFGDEAAVITTNAFIIYSIALIALVYRSVFSKAFYSMYRTKYILLISLTNVILNVVLNVMLIHSLGYIGLATATCLAALLCLPLYFLLFKRAVGSVCYKLFYVKLLKTTFASILMFISLKLLREYIFDGRYNLLIQVCVLLIIVAIGIVEYCVICYLLNVEEIKKLFCFLNAKFFSKKM